jgi:uncharacterized membrane protein (DUF106 family)
MNALGGALTRLFSLLLGPFENGQAFAGIIVVSVVTGAVMMLLFKVTSNQQGMKAVKAKIAAYFLEMRLYKDDFAAVMAAQRRVLAANLGYMKLALLPAVVMIVPVVLIMVQLNLRYAEHGLAPGETAMVKVTVADGADVIAQGLTLTASDGVEKASPAVRIPSLGEVDWKIKLTRPGVHEVTLTSGSGEITLPVFGGATIKPMYSNFRKSSFWDSLLNPGSPVVPQAMQVKSVQIAYTPRSFNFGLFSLSWLWTFLIVSMAFGVILKFVFGVE